MPTVLPFAFLAVHGLSIALLADHARSISLSLLVCAPLLAAAAAVLRAMRGGPRTFWVSAAIGLLLWAGGMAATAFDALFGAHGELVAPLPMLLYVLYGVPLTFALASPRGDRVRLRCVDALLAGVLGVLFYVHTDTFGDAADDAALAHLRWMFDIENLFIALFAGLRFSASDGRDERSFFGHLLAFAVVYAAVAGYVNHVEHDTPYGAPADLLIPLPFLLFATLAFADVSFPAARTSRAWRRIVQAGSPLLLPVSLIVVSAFIAQTQPLLAFAGVAAALAGYGARSVLAQLQLATERDRLDALARVDGLTGIANRRSFDETLARECTRAQRAGEGIAVLIADIDHFKQLNDTLGHQAGDAALRAVALAIRELVQRPGDLAARFGGEEFAVLLPGTDAVSASGIAERIRLAVAALGIRTPAQGGTLTLSLGVGVIDAGSVDPERSTALVAAADAALYDAKHAGRNTVRSRAVADAVATR